ncbi:MAG: IclR family transcriptional regulator C-terminal domain-containing protein [Deltaproteobacteria bacterium]|nr:IclR family transcriptional regulator C-terminal domain-containing protein [Deltaproteobacteria bacterium]
MSTFAEDELVSYLERVERKSYTPHTLVEEQMREELARVREQGFAVDDEEMEEGVRCVASLIFDHRAVAEFGRMVKACAQTVSRELGYHQAPART